MHNKQSMLEEMGGSELQRFIKKDQMNVRSNSNKFPGKVGFFNRGRILILFLENVYRNVIQC